MAELLRDFTLRAEAEFKKMDVLLNLLRFQVEQLEHAADTMNNFVVVGQGEQPGLRDAVRALREAQLGTQAQLTIVRSECQLGLSTLRMEWESYKTSQRQEASAFQAERFRGDIQMSVAKLAFFGVIGVALISLISALVTLWYSKPVVLPILPPH